MSKYTVFTEGGAMAAETHKTRRTALRVLAGAGALVMPTISVIAAKPPDPILAAIARHKAAYEAREATSFSIDDLINDPEGREVSEAEWAALARAHENENAAFDELVTVTPETHIGMRAIIKHLVSIDDGRLSQEMRRLLGLLADTSLLVG